MNSINEVILIRKMEEKDLSSIISIDKKISTYDRPDMWNSELIHYLNKPESICLVAELQGQVIGFMIGAIHPWLFGVANGGWIEILGVHPTHTGKGVGKKLGEWLFKEFKTQGIKVVHTAVDWTSSDLLEFFKALKMTKSGLITLMKEL
ncbi:MAG: GNAT family N-acetyltransferase [Promethearchaeota archaeon]